MQNSLLIESNKDIPDNEISKIRAMIESKLNIAINDVKVERNDELHGGMILRIGKFTLVISTNDFDSLKNKKSLVIKSANSIDENLRLDIINYSYKYFPESREYKPQFIIDKTITAGICISFGDEEIDLTVDNLLDKVFSKI